MYIFCIYREVAMQTVVKKWGNSLALRLPQSLAAGLRLEDGSTVSLSVEDHALVVRPARKRYRLADLLAQTPPEARRGETDWGDSAGSEAW
jgi:antitoxin MazE